MILRRGVFTVVIQLVQIAPLAAITILVTRVTGAHGRGVYALVSSVAIIASMLASLGISWAAIYYIGRRQYPLHRVVSTLLTAALISSAASMTVVGLLYVLLHCSDFYQVGAVAALLM